MKNKTRTKSREETKSSQKEEKTNFVTNFPARRRSLFMAYMRNLENTYLEIVEHYLCLIQPTE